MDEPIARAVTAFNAGDYRTALLMFEDRWHDERDEVLRALINLCNALNQLRLGLVGGPRHNLAVAARLLAEAPAAYAAIDLRAAAVYVQTLRAALPSDGAAAPAWESLPKHRL